MNVLKTDFIKKQKRMQSRRQKVIKTFFSGYHTISNAVPSVGVFKLPKAREHDLRNQLESNFGFSSGLCRVDETVSVEPTSLGVYASGATTSRSGPIDDNLKNFCTRKDSSSSTTLEFQKLLESFQMNHQQADFQNTTDECRGGSNLGKALSNVQVEEKKSSEFTFQSQKNVLMEWDRERQKTTNDLSLGPSASTKETFERYSVVDLSVPRNQRSIEEVLTENERSVLQGGVAEEVIPSAGTRTFRKPASNAKTPKNNKIRKSPKVSGSSKATSSESGAFILAVTEGRGHARGEVGIAAMDPRRPQLVLCQISDSQRYVHSLAKMNVFDFVEVIVPNTFVDGSTPNKLYSDIRSSFPKVTLTSVQRRHFSESVGLDLIKQYCSSESTSVMVLLRDKFYALSAAAALIKYIEFTQNVRLAPQTLKIEYQGMEDTMIIDLNTANLLELVLCANHPETHLNHSLLGVVRYCHTKGGVRLLRANILQPPCSLAKIDTRLDCVTELVNNPLLMCALEAAVSSFSTSEDLLNLCMHAPQQDGLRVAEYQLRYTLLLKSTLELLPTLRSALHDAQAHFFSHVRETLEDVRYGAILDRILQTVSENARAVKGSVSAHLHGCFAIKPGINSLLDIAKKTYCEIVQEISDHVTELRERHDMPLRLAFSAHKGFHIQYTLPPGQRNLPETSLPKDFILAHKSKTTFSFYTADLVALDQRSHHVLNEIKLMTNVILFELLTDIRQHIGCLFNLCEIVAELDVVISFAHVSSGTNYVRPTFGDELSLRGSRHPILDVICDGEVVPNDAVATPRKNFTIITGPNQSGKSIYIRQIALLQIMAQIGCYVPARGAKFRVTDRIFSRLGFDDSIESNASTLMVEMRDVEYLKQNITARSLVIIDELCRGTSVDEGTSLAFAICEELLDTPAFIFFTTHYLLLTKLEDMYFNVANYHLETKIETTPGGKPSVQFTHLRREGATRSDSYGLRVAEMTSFPKDVVSKAEDISSRLSKERKPCREVHGLLAEFELSLRFRNELLQWEPESNWEKMAPIIENHRRLHAELRGRGREAVKGEMRAGVAKSLEKSPRLPEGAGVDGGRRGKPPPSSNKTLLALARTIRRKYAKLRFRRPDNPKITFPSF